jgi:transcriptional regulator with XRE-family HTH domain
MVRVPLTPDEVRRGQEIGALLRQARGARTLMDVAVGAGISPETLRKIETGRMPTPAFVTIAALADVLSVPLDELARICLARVTA